VIWPRPQKSGPRPATHRRADCAQGEELEANGDRLRGQLRSQVARAPLSRDDFPKSVHECRLFLCAVVGEVDRSPEARADDFHPLGRCRNASSSGCTPAC
jgi:hypothetical protein